MYTDLEMEDVLKLVHDQYSSFNDEIDYKLEQQRDDISKSLYILRHDTLQLMFYGIIGFATYKILWYIKND